MTSPHYALRLAVVAVVATLAFAKIAVAQPDLPGSQVRVEKLFDARLADAERVAPTPTLPALDTAVVAQRYEAIPVEPDVAYAPPRIKPLAIKTEDPPEAYKGFARLGVGLPLSWLGDLGYATRLDALALRADAHTYGIRGDYDEDQRYSEVRAGLGATYYTPGAVAVDLDVDYDRRDYRYYGFAEAVRDTSMRLVGEQAEQHFGVFGVELGVRNARPGDSGIDYFGRVGFDILADNFASKERRFRIEAGGRKDFTDVWYAEIALDVDLLSFEADRTQQLYNYGLTPAVGAHFDRWGVRLGAEVTNSSDTFRVFPAVEASYNLGRGFVAVVGADGGLRQNSYRALTEYLPFLVRDPRITNAEVWRGYASLLGLARGVTYKATASYSRINKLAVFATDPSLPYKFRPAYDTAGVVGLELEAEMPVTERLSGSLLVDNRFYTLERFDKPYLLPSFDAQLRAGYEVLPERFTATGILLAQNALPVIGFNDEGEEVSDNVDDGTLLDLSVHGDYRVSKHFAAFAQLNNLLNNRRRAFPNYPMVGTNVLAGVRARF